MSSVQRTKISEISAVPAKDILDNKARVCPPISAICEILDNIFDNYEENKPNRDLAISFVIKSEGSGEISIAENSGGISESKLEPIVRLGVSSHQVKGSVGTWGEGFKVSAFSLGNEVEIFTHFPGQTPIVVHFPDGWLKSDDWNVSVFTADKEAPQQGSTVFRIRNLNRKVDWSEVMRELPIIYGHKINDIANNGRKVHLRFDVDGSSLTLGARPLATQEALRKKLAFPPDFAPRQFIKTWKAESGTVTCKLIVGLTARHSGETSGVYLYGNGRLFARSLRTRAVGYGEGGGAILKDHPSRWRIHAYGFFEADYGSDIPWQAPLKDGVSENHVSTARFREMFRAAVTPYARFAKIAKAADLVPYTPEWEDLHDEERAEVMFRSKAPQVIGQYRLLPDEIKDFKDNGEIETVKVDGLTGEELISTLDQHAKALRPIIARRDAGGPALQLDVLRAMHPAAFQNEKHKPSTAKLSANEKLITEKVKISVEVEKAILLRLRDVLGSSSDQESVRAAIKFAVKNFGAEAKKKTKKKAKG